MYSICILMRLNLKPKDVERTSNLSTTQTSWRRMMTCPDNTMNPEDLGTWTCWMLAELVFPGKSHRFLHRFFHGFFGIFPWDFVNFLILATVQEMFPPSLDATSNDVFKPRPQKLRNSVICWSCFHGLSTGFRWIFWRIHDLRPEVQQACGLHCPSPARLVGMNDQSSFKSLHQRTVGMKICTSAFIF